MQKFATEIATPCLVCSSSSRFWFTKNGHDLFRCGNCRLFFVHPTPVTQTIYKKDYFCGASKGHGYGNYDQDKRSDPAFRHYLRALTAVFPNDGRLVDVGAATGRFVEMANTKGWLATGVEISDFAASKGRESGLDIRTGSLEYQHFREQAFNVVTMWDVFEHIGAPHALLGEAYRVLSRDGILALNLPDTDSLYARLAGSRWQLILPPEHLVLYNRHNLSMILKKHGFQPLIFRRIGKAYRPSYVAQILSTIRGNALLRTLAQKLRDSKIDNVALPINMRDNMFVLARRET